MADDRPSLSRRLFLGGAVALVTAPPSLSCTPPKVDPPTSTLIDGWEVPPGTTLDAPRYARLAAAMGTIVPPATKAHAAWYLDQLLGAFAVTPPRIYAGGPYSGRQGGTDGFSHFLPLTRVEELRWRTYLEGSQGLPEREWNGPVKGLLTQYQEGLDALEVLAQARGMAFTALSRDARFSLLTGANADFVELLYQHAVEGTYGDPVYGGNLGKSGWAAIDYEGDRHPLGYTPRQMLHPEEPLHG